MSNTKLVMTRFHSIIRFGALFLVIALLVTFATPTYAYPSRLGDPKASSRIYTNNVLEQDVSKFSLNRIYELRMQGDGNLVLYKQLYTYVWNIYRKYWEKRWIGREVIWATHTERNGSGFGGENICIMQNDGNLVLKKNVTTGYASGAYYLDIDSGEPYWSTRTHRAEGTYYLEVQDDGNLVIYHSLGSSDDSEVEVVWARK